MIITQPPPSSSSIARKKRGVIGGWLSMAPVADDVASAPSASGSVSNQHLPPSAKSASTTNHSDPHASQAPAREEEERVAVFDEAYYRSGGHWSLDSDPFHPPADGTTDPAAEAWDHDLDLHGPISATAHDPYRAALVSPIKQRSMNASEGVTAKAVANQTRRARSNSTDGGASSISASGGCSNDDCDCAQSSGSGSAMDEDQNEAGDEEEEEEEEEKEARFDDDEEFFGRNKAFDFRSSMKPMVFQPSNPGHVVSPSVPARKAVSSNGEGTKLDEGTLPKKGQREKLSRKRACGSVISEANERLSKHVTHSEETDALSGPKQSSESRRRQHQRKEARRHVSSTPGGTNHIVNGGGGLKHSGIEWSGRTLHAVEQEMEKLGRKEWMSHAPDPVYLASRLEAVRKNLEVEERESEEVVVSLGVGERRQKVKKRWLSWSSDEDKGEKEQDDASGGGEPHRAAVADSDAAESQPQLDQPSLSPPREDVETLAKGQLQLPAILRRSEAAEPASTQKYIPKSNASQESATTAPAGVSASRQMQLDSPGAAAVSSGGSSVSLSTPPRSPPRLLRPPALLAHSHLHTAHRTGAGAQLVDFSRAPPPTQVEAPLAQMMAEERERAREAVRLEAQAAEQDMERLSMALEPVDHQSQLLALQQRVDLRDVRRADLEQVRDLHCLHGDERLLGAEDGSEEEILNIETYTTSATFLLRLLVDENYVAVVAVAKPLPVPAALPPSLSFDTSDLREEEASPDTQLTPSPGAPRSHREDWKGKLLPPSIVSRSDVSAPASTSLRASSYSDKQSESGPDDKGVAQTEMTGATSVPMGGSPESAAQGNVSNSDNARGGAKSGAASALASRKTLPPSIIPDLQLAGPEFIAPPPTKRVMAVPPPKGWSIETETILGVASAIVTYKHKTPESLWPDPSINICGPDELDRSESSTVHVLTLSILPGERSQGLGGKLMDHLMEKAKARLHLQHIANRRPTSQPRYHPEPRIRAYLEVHPSNKRAIELYERKGFTKPEGSSGVKKGFYRGDERIPSRIRLSVGGRDAYVYEKWL